mmetsp:Transcript_24802/g.36391  ORF Transcript_24802/g.36391 Transcript_24802/m.36391 type:complete len:476 (-) Transcript_24802:185-1612(-)
MNIIGVVAALLLVFTERASSLIHRSLIINIFDDKYPPLAPLAPFGHERTSSRSFESFPTTRALFYRLNSLDRSSSLASTHTPNFDNVERIFAISDLHTDHHLNMSWLKERCCRDDEFINPGPKDILIVAGDISHSLSVLEETLEVLIDELKCRIFFICGNHEAWIGGKEMDDAGFKDSISKLKAVEKLCERLGVYTKHRLVGKNKNYPAWVMPIQSWYDGSFMLDGCEDLCEGLNKWPWVDFIRCEWTEQYHPSGKENSKIPVGLTEFFLSQNEKAISEVSPVIEGPASSGTNMSSHLRKETGLITFSHFLPSKRTLPDWKDLESDIFDRYGWLDHGEGSTSAKFAQVAGSALIDLQLRSLSPAFRKSNTHLHVFGHSHRPKDFIFDGIRYIHNPLGKPSERESRMVSPDVDFKLIWDTRSKGGVVPADQLIRYWEEKGGGIEALQQYMRNRKETRRRRLKEIMKKLDAESEAPA